MGFMWGAHTQGPCNYPRNLSRWGLGLNARRLGSSVVSKFQNISDLFLSGLQLKIPRWDPVRKVVGCRHLWLRFEK